VRPRHIAAVALVLGLAVAGFIGTRALAERDARRESERRVAIAAAQIRSRVEVATSLTAGLSRFMSDEGAGGVTNDRFTTIALRWLSPAGLPAVAWAQQVRAGGRAAYERRIGRPMVAPDERRKAVPPASFYLPATLVSGSAPMDSLGIDLRREPGVAAALDRAIRPGGVGATPVAARRDGSRGLFLVAPAPNVIDGLLRPGAVVVFLSEATLRAAARNPPGLRFASADGSSADRAGADAVRHEFAVAGQQFAVAMPKESVSGPGAVLPWIILAAGLLLAALAGALGLIAARRARAQRDFDRIFNLSPDLVAVASFDGHFTRVNPAAEQVLGYPEEELLARPYLDLVHPDDREKTAAEAASIGRGNPTLSFENRLLTKDGSVRVFEWTATPVVEDAVMYGMARDVTERRRAETESGRLAAEQSALRRVAELVARHAPPEEVFARVTEELSELLDVDLVRTVRFEPDGSVTVLATRGTATGRLGPGTNVPLPSATVIEQVLRTGRPARVDEYAHVPGSIGRQLRREGARGGAGGPIVVDGRVWGAMAVASTTRTLAPGTEDRVAQFAELVSTAISNVESRAKVEQLAAEQSALRRVAELVAQQAPPEQVFGLVTEELNRLLGDIQVSTTRFEPDGTATIMATRGAAKDTFPPGRNVPIAGGSTIDQVYRTGRAAHVTDYREVGGEIGPALLRLGLRWGAAGPIVVDGRLWGAMAIAATSETMPPGTEQRVAQFAELVSAAISNIESRGRVEQLAAEQAALRRVAEFVAAQPPPEQVFALVTEELARLLDISMVRTLRFEPDGSATVLAALNKAGPVEPPGTNYSPPTGGVLERVLRTGRPARVDDYAHVAGATDAMMRDAGVRSGAGGPIVVDGLLWGVMVVAADTANVLPAGTEDRIAEFAGLVSTAISNVESRAKVERLAAEQAALRRVATLVASEHSPDELFATLVEEVRVLLGVDASEILRYEADATVTMVAAWSDAAVSLPVGERLSLEGENLAREVLRTGAPGRKEDYSDAPGAIAVLSRDVGIRSAVASPIVVEGAIWGMIAVASRRSEPLPPDTEARLAEFSRVAGIAVANAKSRTELAESRARIVRAGDEARRRFERDLHDGAQQRLVSLGLELRAAEATVPPELDDFRRVLSGLGSGLNEVVDDLRELSRGLHPAVLSEDGLSPALRSLALRSAVPVDVHIDLDTARFEEPVEVAAYYVASEALTNTAKHAHASRAEVRVSRRDGWLELSVTDDGLGGADASRGSGLTGLVDRVEAIGGTIQIDSPPDGGTAIKVKLPTKRPSGPLIAATGR
jgi:PAS domain S-box-containing protein